MLGVMAGTRDIDETKIGVHTINDAVTISGFDVTGVMHGNAVGIDNLVERWCKSKGIIPKHFIPDWAKGKYDAIRRNHEMSDLANWGIFIWDGTPGGTSDNIEYFKSLSKPYYVHTIEPLNCESCKDQNLVFVYGSNTAGKHGRGAAYHAMRKHGAKYGKSGLAGQSYGIPTKDKNIKSLPLYAVKVYIDEFLRFAKAFPNLKFNVTRIGCGLAGFKDEEIAPLFKNSPDNCLLPAEWKALL